MFLINSSSGKKKLKLINDSPSIISIVIGKFCVLLMYNFFLDSTKLKTGWIKITTFFNRRI